MRSAELECFDLARYLLGLSDIHAKFDLDITTAKLIKKNNADLLFVDGTLYCNCCVFKTMRENKFGSQALSSTSDATVATVNTPNNISAMIPVEQL